jgi:hypothetical protein
LVFSMDTSIESSIIGTLLDVASERDYPGIWRMRAVLQARMRALSEWPRDAIRDQSDPTSLRSLMRADAGFATDAVLAVGAEGAAFINQRLEELLALLDDGHLTDEEKTRALEEVQPLIASLPKLPVVDDWERAVEEAGGALAAIDAADIHIRKFALGALASQYMGTRDVHVLRRLAELMSSDSEPTEIRFAAYDALFVVTGKHPSEWPMTMVMSLSPRERHNFKASGVWLADVDWRFVKRWL